MTFGDGAAIADCAQFSRPSRSGSIPGSQARFNPLRISSRALFWALLGLLCSNVGGTVCPYCKDSIPGCTGGADKTKCPLVAGPIANAAVIATHSIATSVHVTKLLPPELLTTFTRTVMDTLVAVNAAPVGGATPDFTDAAYSQSTAVVRAAIHGHCTWEDASLELAQRLETASDESAIAKINAALSLLNASSSKHSSATHESIQSGMGIYTFVWAKIGAHLETVRSGTVKLLVKASSGASGRGQGADVGSGGAAAGQPLGVGHEDGGGYR